MRAAGFPSPAIDRHGASDRSSCAAFSSDVISRCFVLFFWCACRCRVVHAVLTLLQAGVRDLAYGNAHQRGGQQHTTHIARSHARTPLRICTGTIAHSLLSVALLLLLLFLVCRRAERKVPELGLCSFSSFFLSSFARSPGCVQSALHKSCTLFCFTQHANQDIFFPTDSPPLFKHRGKKKAWVSHFSAETCEGLSVSPLPMHAQRAIESCQRAK